MTGRLRKVLDRFRVHAPADVPAPQPSEPAKAAVRKATLQTRRVNAVLAAHQDLQRTVQR